MKEDYYELLGISEDEKKLQGDEFSNLLKKKFRSAALKYHPDRMVGKTDAEKKEADEMFKKINEANSVLSDPAKRERYDRYGDADAQGGFNPFESGGFNPFSGGFNPFGGGFNPFDNFTNQRRTVIGEDVHVGIDISLEEAYRGIKKTITYHRNVPCHDCNGTGSADKKSGKCPYCNGTGMIMNTRREGNTTFMSQSPCPHCHGTGIHIDNPCKSCHGTGLEQKTETLTVDIPVGSFNGMGFVERGMGDAPQGGEGEYGSLIIHINVTSSKLGFVAGDNEINVYKDINIPIADALLGTEIEVEMLDGTKEKIKVDELTESGKQYTFSGKGMPHPKNRTYKGSAVITVKYELPKKLTQKQKELLEEFKKS